MSSFSIKESPSISPYLEIILGPMYSGKTSQIIELYNKYTFCNIPIVVINHPIDTRYHDELLSSHDKKMIPCIKPTDGKLFTVFDNEELSTQIYNAQVILINEGQFFSDLYDFVISMLEYNKKIYIAGLDGDFKRAKFGQILDLIPMCDKVTKLTSLCSTCKDGTPGIFSKRLTTDIEQTVVGSDIYIPVCRMCYQK